MQIRITPGHDIGAYTRAEFINFQKKIELATVLETSALSIQTVCTENHVRRRWTDGCVFEKSDAMYSA